jgi:undecaprenyl diphosphate synthase
MSIATQINKQALPKHVAIIMDGNGRWAKKQGLTRIFGHKNGVSTVKEVVEASVEVGIQYLTLYTFSTENWNRPQAEIDALMQLLVKNIADERPTLMKNKIRLAAIGDLENLPKSCQKSLKETIELTQNNANMQLTLALSYSARWEILKAIKTIAQQYKNGTITDIDQLTEPDISRYLTTATMPDPDLLIRTSGEYRISNFLLWQLAYTEFIFSEKLWPEFTKEDFFQAIIDYQGRERRFGKTSEQLKK